MQVGDSDAVEVGDAVETGDVVETNDAVEAGNLVETGNVVKDFWWWKLLVANQLLVYIR